MYLDSLPGIDGREMFCEPFDGNLLRQIFERQFFSLEGARRSSGEEELDRSRNLTATKPWRRCTTCEQSLVHIMMKYLAVFQQIKAR